MRVLRVYPNPWSARDANGQPCGVCPRDPESDGGGPGQFVGARVDRKQTQVLEDVPEEEQSIRSPRQRTAYEYLGIPASDPQLAEKLAAAQPVAIPRTKYYRDRLAEGSLIPADTETAREARRPFVDPKNFFARYAKSTSAAPTEETATSSTDPGAPATEEAAGADSTPKGRKGRSEVAS